MTQRKKGNEKKNVLALVSKVGTMTLALARTFAPNFGKVEKKVKPDGTIEIVKLSGIRGIGHAGLTSKKLFFSIDRSI